MITAIILLLLLLLIIIIIPAHCASIGVLVGQLVLPVLDEVLEHEGEALPGQQSGVLRGLPRL